MQSAADDKKVPAAIPNHARKRPRVGSVRSLGIYLLSLVLTQGLRLSFFGVLIGLVGAWAVSRWLSAAVPSLPTHDPMVFATVTAVVLGVDVLACYFPARRASGVDPMEALRAE